MFIDTSICLDIHYICRYIVNNMHIYRKIKITYIWNGG
jgi:hypothetical protein